MKIQIKRNTLSATAQPSSVSAGEPLWYKDRLFVGSVGTSAGGECASGGIIELAKDDDILMHDGYVFPNAVQDADGNWYDAVVIGDQVWMTHNLMTTKMPNGTPIAEHSSSSASIPQLYTVNATDYLKIAGRLYNWPAAVNGTSVSSTPHQGIAPNGWHIPSEAEWRTLIDYLLSKKRYRGANYPSEQPLEKKVALFKSITTNGDGIQTTANIGTDLYKNNSAGLKLVCGGYYVSTVVGLWTYGMYWTSSTPNNNTQSISFNNKYHEYSASDMYNIIVSEKQNYLSVRCIANLSPIQFRAWYYNQYGSFNNKKYGPIESIDLRR